MAEPYPGVAEPIPNLFWAWPNPIQALPNPYRTLSGFGRTLSRRSRTHPESFLGLAEPYPGFAEPYPNPHLPQKSKKTSGAEKTSFLYKLYVKIYIFRRWRSGILLLGFRPFRVRFDSLGFGFFCTNSKFQDIFGNRKEVLREDIVHFVLYLEHSSLFGRSHSLAI